MPKREREGKREGKGWRGGAVYCRNPGTLPGLLLRSSRSGGDDRARQLLKDALEALVEDRDRHTWKSKDILNSPDDPSVAASEKR